jgi:hypothetical protein
MRDTHRDPIASKEVQAFAEIINDKGLNSPEARLAFSRIPPARQMVLKMQLKQVIKANGGFKKKAG